MLVKIKNSPAESTPDFNHRFVSKLKQDRRLQLIIFVRFDIICYDLSFFEASVICCCKILKRDGNRKRIEIFEINVNAGKEVEVICTEITVFQMINVKLSYSKKNKSFNSLATSIIIKH